MKLFFQIVSLLDFCNFEFLAKTDSLLPGASCCLCVLTTFCFWLVYYYCFCYCTLLLLLLLHIAFAFAFAFAFVFVFDLCITGTIAFAIARCDYFCYWYCFFFYYCFLFLLKFLLLLPLFLFVSLNRRTTVTPSVNESVTALYAIKYVSRSANLPSAQRCQAGLFEPDFPSSPIAS